MPSGWSTYYAVFLSSALALLIPSGLATLAWILRRSEVGRKGPSRAYPRREKLGERINIRFFLGANSALALIALALLLVPCASALGIVRAGEARNRVVIAIVVIAAIAGTGLLYASRKGDTRWLETYREAGPRGAPPSREEP